METNQYDTKPTTDGSWDISHLSHFYWTKSASESYKQEYEEMGTSSTDTFFAVEVGAIPGWTVLSGENSGEWKYIYSWKQPPTWYKLV